MTAVRSRHFLLSPDLIIPLILLAAAVVIFRTIDLDMSIQRLFYHSGSGWHLGGVPLPRFIYHYGNLPALVLALSGLLLFAFSYQRVKTLKWRKIGIFLLLSMIVGPGLIVNTILKDQWGRPRPRNVIEFGGSYEYEPLLTMDRESDGKSFPCGHATMGFYLFVPWFLLRHSRRILAGVSLALGIGAGALIGYIRMIQGGHFASDVLIAGILVYLTAFAMFRILGLHRNIWFFSQPDQAQKRLNPVTRVMLIILGIALILAVLLATPYNRNQTYQLNDLGAEEILELRIVEGDLHIGMADSTYFESETTGFGFPGSKLRWRRQQSGEYSRKTILHQEMKGLFTELSNLSRLSLERSRAVDLVVLSTNESITADLSAADSIRDAVFIAGDAQISITLPAGYDQGVVIAGDPRLNNPQHIRIVDLNEEPHAPPVIIKMRTGELTLRRISLDSYPLSDKLNNN